MLPPYLRRDHKMQIIKKYLFLTQEYKYECKNLFYSTKVYCYCFIVHNIEKGMQLRKDCKLLTEEGDFLWINIVWLNVRFKVSHCLFLIWCFSVSGAHDISISIRLLPLGYSRIKNNNNNKNWKTSFCTCNNVLHLPKYSSITIMFISMPLTCKISWVFTYMVLLPPWTFDSVISFPFKF